MNERRKKKKATTHYPRDAAVARRLALNSLLKHCPFFLVWPLITDPDTRWFCFQLKHKITFFHVSFYTFGLGNG